MKYLLLLSLLFSSQFIFANTKIHLVSDSGEYIGRGLENTFTDDLTVTINKSKVNISHTSGYRFEFVAPNNRNLEYGLFKNAERAPFRGPLSPGLSVSSSGRGCNTISGEFVIYEFDSQSNQKKLALDFIQFCGNTTKKLVGTIRINSSIPAPYEKPFSIIALETPIVFEGNKIVVNATDSFSKVSPISSYLWQQISGPILTILDVNAERTEIENLEIIKLGGETALLSLTITNAAAETSTSEIGIKIKSKSDPVSYFTMKSEGGDYIGQGKDWHYNLSDSQITARRNSNNGVSLNIRGTESWSANFAAKKNVELTVGEYLEAERFPFQDEDHEGLSISGDGRGCNQNVGSFEVKKILWEKSKPIEFKATFKQRCSSDSAPLLSGEIAFNARHESVPTANAGTDIEILEGRNVNLNGSKSTDDIGSINSYKWSTEDSSIVINNSTESRAYFKSNKLDDKEQQKTIKVDLLIEDDEGYRSKDTVSILIKANNSIPVTQDDAVTILVGESINISPLINDSDVDGRVILETIDIVKSAQFGSVVVNSQGIIIYKHTGTAAVLDTIEYTVADNDGGVSEKSTIEINVTAPEPDPETDQEADPETDQEADPEPTTEPDTSAPVVESKSETSSSGSGSLNFFWGLIAILSFRAIRNK